MYGQAQGLMHGGLVAHPAVLRIAAARLLESRICPMLGRLRHQLTEVQCTGMHLWSCRCACLATGSILLLRPGHSLVAGVLRSWQHAGVWECTARAPVAVQRHVQHPTIEFEYI